jgi:hypothetical protein
MLRVFCVFSGKKTKRTQIHFSSPCVLGFLAFEQTNPISKPTNQLYPLINKSLMTYYRQPKTQKNEANSCPFLTKSVSFIPKGSENPMVSNLCKTNPNRIQQRMKIQNKTNSGMTMKKRNEPKAGGVSVLHFIENTKQTQFPSFSAQNQGLPKNKPKSNPFYPWVTGLLSLDLLQNKPKKPTLRPNTLPIFIRHVTQHKTGQCPENKANFHLTFETNLLILLCTGINDNTNLDYRSSL